MKSIMQEYGMAVLEVTIGLGFIATLVAFVFAISD